MTLFGKMIFADVINLRSREKIVLDYPRHPKSNVKCPYKRHTEENRNTEEKEM